MRWRSHLLCARDTTSSLPFLAQRLALQRVSWSGHRPLHRPVGAFAKHRAASTMSQAFAECMLYSVQKRIDQRSKLLTIAVMADVLMNGHCAICTTLTHWHVPQMGTPTFRRAAWPAHGGAASPRPTIASPDCEPDETRR